MGFLTVYGIFVLTTVVIAFYRHFRPCVLKIAEEFPEEPVGLNKLVAYITFICIAIVFAPLLFPAVISPSIGERFEKAMYEGLSKKSS